MNLTNGNVSLRELGSTVREDLAALINNRNVLDNLRDWIPYPYSVNDADEYIALAAKDNPSRHLGIYDGNNFAGCISVMAQFDVYHRTAEIGYWIGEPFWSKGIATKALSLATAYGFEYFDIVRIHTGVFSFNEASMKVLRKCGYKFEGIFRSNITKNGQTYDEHRFAILKSEYVKLSNL